MKPLSRLERLTDAQRAQIAAWLQDCHSYEKIIALAREQFGLEIPRMTLSRYRSRLALTELLDDSPESTAAAAEIAQYAATGQDNFSPATLHILERRVFELSLTCLQVDEDMAALKTLSAILSRHRNTTVRERLAAVQERKCQLRHQELKLKAAIRGIPLPDSESQPDKGITDSPSPSSTVPPQTPQTIPFPAAANPPPHTDLHQDCAIPA
jgi:hypothetical protein